VTEAGVPARRSARRQAGVEGSVRRQAGAETAPYNSINAGLGGVGGGTGIVAIAQQVGVHTVLGEVLIYVVPVVSVIAGAVLYQLKFRVDWYNERSQVKKARRTLEEQLRYPHTSEEHKAKIREMLEEIDHSVAVAELARIKFFGSSGR